MRAKVCKAAAHSHRVVERFLLFPLTFRDEWRWLETAYVFQIYSAKFGWLDCDWSTEEEYLAWKETQ